MRKKLVDLIDEDRLRHLYEVELVSENEIARRLGTHQANIGRLRRRYKIPTISHSERTARRIGAEVSPRQHQILIGSLLGDGWMDETSPQSARFQESHSRDQQPYSDWKADQLEPFISSRFNREKRDPHTGKVYLGRSFATVSCHQLRPYFDLYYPAPDRVRVFPKNLPDIITPLALAVWYMDDGSVTVRGEPRIAFGLDSKSLHRALRALRKLGLKPKRYGEGGNQVIHFPKQAMAFKALVEPHIPECMAYKLPRETRGQATHRNARALTPEKAARLYLGGLSTQEIASTFGVGTSTVSRRLKTAEVKKRWPGPRPQKITLEAAEALLGAVDPKVWAGLSEGEQSAQVEQILKILQATEFPFPVRDPAQALVELAKVQGAEMHLDDGRVMPIRRVGIGACKGFFPNRYRAVSMTNTASAWEAWHTEALLRRAIRFQLKVGDPVLPHRVLRAVTMNCRTPTVFRPTLAKFIYERFLEPGQMTWDPCSGYGGRLMGAAAAKVQYVATEVEPETVRGNQELAEALGFTATVHCCPAEEFDPPPVQLVFTSPPYFHQERYQGGAQSWRSYPGLDAWVEGFLRPVVERGASALTPGGHWVMNIADVKNRTGAYPLVEAARKVMAEAGLAERDMLKMPLPKLNRKDPWEPILVFQKRDQAGL